MRILFISSRNIIAADLARLMRKEGNEVKLYIDDRERRLNFENIVDKTDDWRKELGWVGKDGLIVFDDSGYGKIQDDLRARGYSVFGGNDISDKLEFDREFAQVVFRKFGLQTLETINFNSIDECIAFVRNSQKNWVVKQNDHKLNVNYVSQLDDNRDVLDVLEYCKEKHGRRMKMIAIQEKVTGVEVGVGRYFNGTDWVGPIEINFEHKRLFAGGIGPMTTEMGTLAWYDDNENNKLFQATIEKLKPYLKEINFKGDFEIDCIINEDGVFPLEASPRLGSPIIYLQAEIHKSPWGEFLKAIADGKDYALEWNRGYGIVVLVAAPPFPYVSKLDSVSPKGMGIYFNGLEERHFDHIYFEGVAKRDIKDRSTYYISDGEGYVAYVTSVDEVLEKATGKVYDIIGKIHFPRMFYRNDIGFKFADYDSKLLKDLGYLD